MHRGEFLTILPALGNLFFFGGLSTLGVMAFVLSYCILLSRGDLIFSEGKHKRGSRSRKEFTWVIWRSGWGDTVVRMYYCMI